MGFRNRLAMCLAMCLILTSIPITAIADETDFIPNQCEVGYEYFSKKMNSPSDISEIECEEDASEAEQFVQEDAFSDELHINNEDFSLCTSGEGGELATSGEIAITETLYWGIHDFTLFVSTFDQSSQSYVSGSFNSTEQWYYPNQKAPWSGSTFYNAVVGNPKANDIVVPRYTSAWFAGCQYVKTIDLQGLDTSRVLNMNQMFRGCYALEALDLSNFDTSASYSMSAMFSGCRSLKELDLSSFDTSKVTSMYTMFCQCAELTELDISSFDTSSVTDMYEMFWGCEKLESLDVSNFDTSKVTRMYYMFNDCKSLQELDLSNFDTSNVYDMHFMFAFLKSVKELDLSNFNTSKVTDMTYMFAGCEELCSLDISSFDTSMVTSNDGLFRFSGKLRELIKGEKTIFGNKLFEAGSGYLNVSSFWYDENGTQYWANDVGTAPAGKYICFMRYNLER